MAIFFRWTWVSRFY